jgi:uncharacterized membrane protein
MMLMWIPLVLVIVLLVPGVTRWTGSRRDERPEDVLRMRLARGEITAEDFDRLMEKLR